MTHDESKPFELTYIGPDAESLAISEWLREAERKICDAFMIPAEVLLLGSGVRRVEWMPKESPPLGTQVAVRLPDAHHHEWDYTGISDRCGKCGLTVDEFLLQTPPTPPLKTTWVKMDAGKIVDRNILAPPVSCGRLDDAIAGFVPLPDPKAPPPAPPKRHVMPAAALRSPLDWRR